MNKEDIFIIVLRELRISSGMTQELLAEKACINEKYFGRIERGESSPSFRKIIKICEALNISLHQFMLYIDNYK